MEKKENSKKFKDKINKQSTINNPPASASRHNFADVGGWRAGQQLATKLSWLPNKTFELEFTLPWGQVKETYQKVLKELSLQITLKGFRKGKAPLSLVEKNIDKSRLYSEVLRKLLPQTYVKSVNQHNLKPICDPQIEAVKTEEEKDWVFKATACEAPEVNLGDYEAKIRAVRAKEKIWLPGKDKSLDKKERDKEADLKEIFNLLLKECRVELAQILVEQEQKRMLARLLNEIKKLGLTLDDYLASNQKTIEQLREEYKKLAEDTLKLEFILQEIARQKNFTVSSQEIDKTIAAVPDENTKENLKTPLQRAYIASILRKRKVIDYLSKL